MMIAGALLLSPWLPQGVVTLTAPGTAPSSIWALVVLGVLPAAIGYATWAYALGYFGATRAANFLYLVPAVATALAYVLTSEIPKATTLIGGAIAICGVILMNTRGRL
jgi:drug/metabolite transporter (DMT)-like permease